MKKYEFESKTKKTKTSLGRIEKKKKKTIYYYTETSTERKRECRKLGIFLRAARSGDNGNLMEIIWMKVEKNYKSI